MATGSLPPEANPVPGRMSRERTVGLALLIVTGVAIYLCYRVVSPFFPALAWAMALAVIATPGHRWIERRVRPASLAAALSVLGVSLTIIAPLGLITPRLVRDTSRYAGSVQQEVTSGAWRKRLDSLPRVKALVTWAISSGETSKASDEKTDETSEQQSGETSGASEKPSQSTAEQPEEPAEAAPGESDEESGPQSQSAEEPPAGGQGASAGSQPPMALPYAQAASVLSQGLASLMSGTVWLVMQVLIMLMTLFYFFRDRQQALEGIRGLMPLDDPEVDQIFDRVSDTIHATIFGSLVVALVQGTMGGLIFWWLDFPSAVFWGAVMTLLAVVPTLGTFVVWGPAAIYLASQGEWTTALILAVWGGVAIALIDNLLYPWLVGERLRFHTLLVFLAIVGGLGVFGASGIILGPVLLAFTDALLQIWRRRTSPLGEADSRVIT